VTKPMCGQEKSVVNFFFAAWQEFAIGTNPSFKLVKRGSECCGGHFIAQHMSEALCVRRHSRLKQGKHLADFLGAASRGFLYGLASRSEQFRDKIV
jgi:hypothetical protein